MPNEILSAALAERGQEAFDMSAQLGLGGLPARLHADLKRLCAPPTFWHEMLLHGEYLGRGVFLNRITKVADGETFTGQARDYRGTYGKVDKVVVFQKGTRQQSKFDSGYLLDIPDRETCWIAGDLDQLRAWIAKNSVLQEDALQAFERGDMPELGVPHVEPRMAIPRLVYRLTERQAELAGAMDLRRELATGDDAIPRAGDLLAIQTGERLGCRDRVFTPETFALWVSFFEVEEQAEAA